MTQITKDMAMHLRKKLPRLQIHRTVHKWYVEETTEVCNEMAAFNTRYVVCKVKCGGEGS